MKKWMLILLGFILLVVMCGTLMLASAIYDSGNKTAIDAYFFQNTPLYRSIRYPKEYHCPNGFPHFQKLLNVSFFHVLIYFFIV